MAGKRPRGGANHPCISYLARLKSGRADQIGGNYRFCVFRLNSCLDAGE
jgi:hypothetical protein